MPPACAFVRKWPRLRNGLTLALNGLIVCGLCEASHMPKRTSASIARKAQAKAEADFATWLMMAKLGGFDDLPTDAQSWLMNYRTRLEKMSEANATSATTRELYVQYYADMGGEGDPPEMASIAEPAKNNVVDLKNARVARSSRATDSSTPARPRRALSPFLIFAGMVAIIAAIKFAFG
jgi:hypothetical protein